MPHRELFPTLLQEENLAETLVSDLHEACWMIEDGDQAGHAWCEAQGYPGYTSYASLEDLPQRHPAFADLVQELDTYAANFAALLDWELGEARLDCDSLWVNILGEGGQHSGHIHPNSVISGTAYIAMPEGAGALKLEDPRLPALMAAPPLTQTAKHPRFVYLAPKVGQVFMWESWLRHEVMPNRSESARISISFNYSVTDA